jgi:hypothetical protein
MVQRQEQAVPLDSAEGFKELQETQENTVKTNKGWVAEWSKAAVLKTAVGVSPPQVRILSHPLFLRFALFRRFGERIGHRFASKLVAKARGCAGPIAKKTRCLNRRMSLIR